MPRDRRSSLALAWCCRSQGPLSHSTYFHGELQGLQCCWPYPSRPDLFFLERVWISLLEYLWEKRWCWFMVYMNSEPAVVHLQTKRKKIQWHSKSCVGQHIISPEKLWRVTYASLRLTFCRLYVTVFGRPNYMNDLTSYLSPSYWGHGYFYSHGGPEHFLRSTAARKATNFPAECHTEPSHLQIV